MIKYVKGASSLKRSAFLHSNLHPTRQPEHDSVLAVHRHAVHQPGPQALIKLGDELRQILHALYEPLDLPAPDHNLVDLFHDGIALVLGFLIAADQRVVSLVVFLLVLRHPGVAGNQVVHRLGVDAKLLIQNPARFPLLFIVTFIVKLYGDMSL